MSGRQRAVPEKEYKRWEQEVVNKFYTESQAHTELVPTDGHPSIVQKEKVIAVVLAGDGGMIDQVAREEIDELPRKGGHIMLFHIGKDEKDGVSYGYIEEKKEFVHPGIDVGGLTNYRQPIGKSANFIPDADAHFVIGPHCDAESAGMLGSQLRETWNKYAPKPLPQDFNTKLSEVVRSIHDVFQDNGGAVLKFWKPPSEHRVLVTSADVRARTGKYYERVFGKGLYAMESDGIGLFAGVSKSSITPNINQRNIDLEYIPYAPAPPTCTTSSSSRCVPTSRRRPCRCWAAATAALPVLVGAALASGIQRFKSMDEHRRSQALDSLYKWSLRVGADRLDGSVLREGPGLDVDVPPTLVGKSAVITGGTKGCGFHAAVNFKALGADVVISGRSEAKAGDAARKIAELGGRRPGAAAGPHRVVRPEESYGSVVGLPLDTTVFETVRRFAFLVVRAVPSPSIDFLILNAGTSHSDADQEACVAQGYPRCLKPALGRACPAKCRDDTEWVAKSGHNRVMAGNHLGHFLLASMLAPHLAPDASVVVVSSLAMWFGNPHWLMQHWGSPPQRLETVKEEIKGGGDLRSRPGSTC
ncbi:unnamed protein product [Prorocentrum cordatum]|uniref:Uncharacterized protein n=1 Tax=Prorocentrum cordatum TaxID=2364126 RepID=A0ABN9R7C0_9DINO|nr:unnamed protein product [Polarella glacialis]